MENIKIKIIKDGVMYTKLEKTYSKNGKPYKYFLYSEDGDNKISAKQFKDFYVECNECKDLVHFKGNVLILIEKGNFLCRKCRSKGERNGMYGKRHTEETRRKLSELNKLNPPFKGRHHTEKSKQLISKAKKGKLVGEKNPMYGVNVYDLILKRDGIERVNEIKEKISKNVSGEKNPFYGKHHTQETKNKLSEFSHSQKMIEIRASEDYRRKLREGMLKSDVLKQSRASLEYRNKLKNALKNSDAFQKVQEEKRTPENREKRRILTAQQIIRNLKLMGLDDGKHHFIPNFNPKACEYFDKLMKENGTNIQHALNGGEFGIPELGYFVDGYDKENNIVYEYDENYHKTTKQQEKDKIREEKIKKFLNCKFIRIKEYEISRD